MNRPPLLARVRFSWGSLWLPIFLAWLLAGVLLLPLLALVALATPVTPRQWRLLPLLGGAWRVLCAARGTEIELRDTQRHVSITLI